MLSAKPGFSEVWRCFQCMEVRKKVFSHRIALIPFKVLLSKEGHSSKYPRGNIERVKPIDCDLLKFVVDLSLLSNCQDSHGAKCN